MIICLDNVSAGCYKTCIASICPSARRSPTFILAHSKTTILRDNFLTGDISLITWSIQEAVLSWQRCLLIFPTMSDESQATLICCKDVTATRCVGKLPKKSDLQIIEGLLFSLSVQTFLSLKNIPTWLWK